MLVVLQTCLIIFYIGGIPENMSLFYEEIDIFNTDLIFMENNNNSSTITDENIQYLIKNEVIFYSKKVLATVGGGSPGTNDFMWAKLKVSVF